MAKKYVAVMDIGSKSIRVLIGAKGVNETFIVHGYGEKNYDGYYEGEFLEENLGEVIQSCISDAQNSSNIKISKLYVGVPADFSCCKTKTFAYSFNQKTKLTEQVLDSIYEQSNDVDVEDYVNLSTSPISFVLDDGKKVCDALNQKTTKISVELCFMYAQKSFIEKINTCLTNIGITFVEYMSAPLCESIYLLPQDRREDGAIVIDCGYIETSVSVVKGNGLVKLKSFAVGGGHISADLMECLNISFNEAEMLRKQIVLSIVPTQEDEYEINSNGNTLPISMINANEITTARLEMFAELIKRCILSEDQTLPNIPIYLTGGGISYIKGAKEVIANYLKTSISLLLPKDVHLAKPHYSAILGLCDSALEHEKTEKFGMFKRMLGKK